MHFILRPLRISNRFIVAVMVMLLCCFIAVVTVMFLCCFIVAVMVMSIIFLYCSSNGNACCVVQCIVAVMVIYVVLFYCSSNVYVYYFVAL